MDPLTSIHDCQQPSFNISIAGLGIGECFTCKSNGPVLCSNSAPSPCSEALIWSVISSRGSKYASLTLSLIEFFIWSKTFWCVGVQSNTASSFTSSISLRVAVCALRYGMNRPMYMYSPDLSRANISPRLLPGCWAAAYPPAVCH